MPIPTISKTKNSQGEVASLVASNARLLKAIVGFNASASAQYIQVFDSATVPANGTSALLSVKVFADQHFTFDYPGGRPFTNGICVCNSSTDTTKTIGSADCLIDISYE